MTSCSGKRYVQFALGGAFLPSEDQWIGISEKLRGRTVRTICQMLTGGLARACSSLSEGQREKISLISGKDGRGKPLAGHPHAYFLVWPDEHHYPTHRTAFHNEEL